MKRFAFGLIVGVALVVGLAGPSIRRGDGTGSDHRGDYDYEWLQLEFARNSLELKWWGS